MENVVARVGALRGSTTLARSAIRRLVLPRLRAEGDPSGLATELHVPGPIRRQPSTKIFRRGEYDTSATGFHRFYGLFEPFPGSAMVSQRQPSCLWSYEMACPCRPDKCDAANLANLGAAHRQHLSGSMSTRTDGVRHHVRPRAGDRRFLSLRIPVRIWGAARTSAAVASGCRDFRQCT